LSSGYRTTTCRAMSWLRLPELAVTVAVYVPGGVPGVVWEEGELLPHPTHDARASNIGAASRGRRLRSRRDSHHKVRSIKVHASGIASGRKLTGEPRLVVTGPIVPTDTATGCAPLPLICTELGKVQVGAGVTTGVMAQLRLTVPLKDADAMTTRLKLALCPALIVWEIGDPVAGPRLKSGATVNVTDVACMTVPEVPVMVIE
jgi:hypothetical protein